MAVKAGQMRNAVVLAGLLAWCAASPAPVPVKLVASYGAADVVYASLWVTAKAGIFAQHGLDVDVQYQASSIQIPSLISGDVKLALVGCSEVAASNAAGSDLVILANIAPVLPYLFMVPADVKSPADLRGKVVGVSRFGDTTDVAARMALARLGIKPADVSFVQVGSASNRAAALLGGVIQGGVLSPPITYSLQQRGFHPLVDLAKLRIPASLALTGRRDWVEANRDLVQRYVDALVDGIARIKHDKPYTLGILRDQLKLDDAGALSAAYDYNVAEILPTYPHANAEQCRLSLETLATTDPRLKTIDLTKLIDDEFVVAAAKHRH